MTVIGYINGTTLDDMRDAWRRGVLPKLCETEDHPPRSATHAVLIAVGWGRYGSVCCGPCAERVRADAQMRGVPCRTLPLATEE